MEDVLVSFGNYLLEKYNVSTYSNEGNNETLYQRKVSDADLANWREFQSKAGQKEDTSGHNANVNN